MFRIRKRTPAPRARLKLILWVGSAVLLFVCLALAAEPGGEGLGSELFGSGAFDVVAAALLAIFGRAAFLLPIAPVALGVIGYWRFHYVRRRRLTLRLVAMTPLLACCISGVGALSGSGTLEGGVLGTLYINYCENAAGFWGGKALGTLLVATLGGWLFGCRLRPIVRRCAVVARAVSWPCSAAASACRTGSAKLALEVLCWALAGTSLGFGAWDHWPLCLLALLPGLLVRKLRLSYREPR